MFLIACQINYINLLKETVRRVSCGIQEPREVGRVAPDLPHATER